MDWFDFFYNELKKDSIRTLVKKVQHFYETSTCYPEHSNIFNAFKLTPLDKVKVVIVGQDPYHEEKNMRFFLTISYPLYLNLKNM